MHAITLHQLTVKLRHHVKALGTAKTAIIPWREVAGTTKHLHFSSPQGEISTVQDIVNKVCTTPIQSTVGLARPEADYFYF